LLNGRYDRGSAEFKQLHVRVQAAACPSSSSCMSEFKLLVLASFKRREPELVEQLRQRAWNNIVSNLAAAVAFTVEEVGWKHSLDATRLVIDESPGASRVRSSRRRSAAEEADTIYSDTVRTVSRGTLLTYHSALCVCTGTTAGRCSSLWVTEFITLSQC
jgi:hypothetical protein